MEEKTINTVCTSVAVTSTLLQSQVIFQIISLILTTISTLIIICFNLYKWFKKAKEDKHISETEIKEGVEILNKGIEDIQNISEKGEK